MNSRNSSNNAQNSSSSGRNSLITYLRNFFSNSESERNAQRNRTNSNISSNSGNSNSINNTNNSNIQGEEPVLSREVLQMVWNRMQSLSSDQRNSLLNNMRSPNRTAIRIIRSNERNQANQGNEESGDEVEDQEAEEEEEERPATRRYRYYDDLAESNDEILNPQQEEEYIDYRTYPLVIDWYEIENDRSDAYSICSKYGYFGVSLFTTLSNVSDLVLTANKFQKYILEYYHKLYSKVEKENSKKLNTFIESLPDLTIMRDIIYKLMITEKEYVTIKIVLDIYEHYYTNYESFTNKKLLKEFLPTANLFYSILSDEDVKNIFDSIQKLPKEMSEIMSKFDIIINSRKVEFFY